MLDYRPIVGSNVVSIVRGTNEFKDLHSTSSIPLVERTSERASCMTHTGTVHRYRNELLHLNLHFLPCAPKISLSEVSCPVESPRNRWVLEYCPYFIVIYVEYN